MLQTVQRVMRHQQMRAKKKRMVLAPHVGSGMDHVVSQSLAALGYRQFDGLLAADAGRWTAQLQGHDAVSGWTVLRHFGPLFERYPSALVLLPGEMVEACVEALVFRHHAYRQRYFPSAADREVFEGVFRGQYEHSTEATAQLHARFLEIFNKVPPKQLLVLRPSDDWQRLCDFLQKDQPLVPFPKPLPQGSAPLNHAMLSGFVLVALVGLVGFLLYYLCLYLAEDIGAAQSIVTFVGVVQARLFQLYLDVLHPSFTSISHSIQPFFMSLREMIHHSIQKIQ